MRDKEAPKTTERDEPMALLTPEQITRARRVNPYYQRRLGWPAVAPVRDAGSEDFAFHIARYQRVTHHTRPDRLDRPLPAATAPERGADRRRGKGGAAGGRGKNARPAARPVPPARTLPANAPPLRVDGILGPRTWAYMNQRVWQPPVSNCLIVNGEAVEVPFGVVTFEEPEGMSFYGQPNWQPRTDPTGQGVNTLVLHWDECLSSHHCFHVLLDRKLSAHLLVDGDGTVYQTLDLAEARAWHAKQANDRSIGIEVQNPVHLPCNAEQKPPRVEITEPRAHAGTPHTHLDFYAIQKERVAQITAVLCRLFPIPKQLPERAPGQLIMGLAANNFTGVCGHFHVSQEKVDPGSSLWPAVRQVLGLPEAEPSEPALVEAPATPAQDEAVAATPEAPQEAAPAVDREA